MRPSRLVPLFGLVAFASLVLVSARAVAGNDDGVLLGNEAAMTGGSGGAIASDGTGAWYNPAAVAGVERDSIDVSGAATMLRIGETPSLLTSATGRHADGGYFELTGIPSAVTITRRLDCSTALSLGLWVPTLTGHTDRVNLDDPTVDFTARWQLVQQESSQNYYVGITLAGIATSTLRLGITLYGLYRQSTLVTHFFGGVEEPDPMLPGATRVRGAQGFAELESLQSVGLELGAGLQWEAVPGLFFGVALRSPGLQLGSLRRSTVSLFSAASGGTVDFDAADTSSLAPNVAPVTPMRLRVSAAWRFMERAWIGLDVDVQHELYEPSLGVRRHWLVNARVGGRFWLEENLSMGIGFFTDLSPRDAVVRYGETNIDFFGGSIGLEVHTPHRLGPGENADTIVFAQTFALRYAAGVGTIGGLRVDADAPLMTDPMRRLPVATTGTTIHELSLHIGSALYF